MNIDSYSFGRITVDGKNYTNDIKIINGRLVSNWWRKEGHFLQLEDIEDILSAEPEVLIIGTGAAGVMRVDSRLLHEVEKRNIKAHVLKSAEAVRLFNDLSKKLGPEKVSLAIHLTC